MASSGIPVTGTVSIGSQAGTTRSINVLMGLAASTLNSSLSGREQQAMTYITTYGVCMPGELEKSTITWAPTAAAPYGTPGNSYLPARLSEFRGSYSWPQIIAGNPIIASNNANPPGPGNSILTMTGNGSPAYTGLGTPYFFYIDGPSGRLPASGWRQATQDSDSATTFGGDGTGLAVGSYTVWVKDFEGCGTLENIKITATVSYP